MGYNTTKKKSFFASVIGELYTHLAAITSKKNEKYCRRLFESDTTIEGNSFYLRLNNKVYDIYCENNVKHNQ